MKEIQGEEENSTCPDKGVGLEITLEENLGSPV
jgi:hypothetical protein